VRKAAEKLNFARCLTASKVSMRKREINKKKNAAENRLGSESESPTSMQSLDRQTLALQQ
jgi:hypothetical protein